MKYLLVIMLAINGITTNSITDSMSVSYGIVMLDIPSRYVTMGTYANSMMMSLVATCTRVYAGFPLVSSLHTNTIAVHGAVPSSTAPIRYCVAKSEVMIDW